MKTYKLAEKMGKPLAATATGGDWYYVMSRRAEDLVRFWIGLAYAHGQWFMVPHPKNQYAFSEKTGTEWYAAPIDAYAPVYQFIRRYRIAFDDMDSLDATALSPDDVLTTVRGNDRHVVVHVLNRDYDRQRNRINPKKYMPVVIPTSLFSEPPVAVVHLSYDSDPELLRFRKYNNMYVTNIPELNVWSLIVFVKPRQ